MKRTTLGLWSAVLLGFAATAPAQEDTAARACTKIPGAAERLACYDAAFGMTPTPAAGAPAPAAVASPGAPAAAAPAATAPAASGAAQFGDDGQLAAAKLKKTTTVPSKLTATIVTAASFGKGLYRITLDNGQVWDTLQTDWALDFKSSDTVTLSRMLFGAYQISHAGQGLSVAARRIR